MHQDFDFSPPSNDALRKALQSQRNILVGEGPVRLVATTLGYAIAAAYIPIGFVIIVAAINLLAEVFADVLLRDVDALLARRRRRVVLSGCTFVHEACFMLPPAMMWHLDDPMAKAIAVGLTASTMMHIATVRAIYLPLGLAGAGAIWIIVLISNTLYWTRTGEWLSLAVSTLCALVSLGYFVSALLSNHNLHRRTAAGWAEAETANAAKTRFLAQMSHELRTPLNAILGMGHAELARQTDPVSRSRMDLLVQSAAGLGVLLDDILDLSAVQEGSLPIRPEVIDPGAILTASVALFRPLAEAASLRLDLSLDPDLPVAATADGRRMRQCISNILSNALKYTDAGSVRLSARMHPAGVLRIEVHDTGQGVPEDAKDTIFAPFHRGPGLQAGTGLGLTISRTLARRMGGDLVLLPSVSGARFCLTLPLGPADPPPPAAANMAQPDLRGHRVMVVDDIATNRLVAATYLRLFGAQVTEAESGHAALLLLDTARPAVILLDMNMPGMGGVETLQRLRKARHGRVPVIAMTADATEDHRRGYLAAGLDGYVAKPLSPDRLAEALRPHLPVLDRAAADRPA